MNRLSSKKGKIVKIMATILSIIMLSSLFAFTGCKRDSDDAEHKIVVSILNKSSEKTMYGEIAQKFEESHAGVKVELKPLSNYETDVRSKLRAGERIDVIHLPDNYLTIFADDGIITNLDPFIQSSGLDMSLYFDSMMKLGKLYHDSSKPQYMIPRDYSKFVVYYNKDIFDNCSVAYPKKNWTWDEFMETCRLLYGKLQKGYVCIDASMTYSILNYGIISSFGVDKYIDDNYDFLSDVTNIKAGLEMIKKDVIDTGYVVKPEVYNSGDFIRQAAAMSIGVRPTFSEYKNAELNFDVVEFPSIGDNPKVGSGTSGFGISSVSEEKELSWEFIQYVISEEGQKLMSKSGGIVPVLKSLAEDPEADWKKVTNGVNEAINSEAFYSHNERDVVNSYWGSLPSKAISLYESYWHKCMSDYLNGKDSFDNCLNTLNKQIKGCKRMYPEYFN